METGASLRALKPTSLRTGGLSHTPLREKNSRRGKAPPGIGKFGTNLPLFEFDAICFAAEAAKFCEAGLVARRATLAVGGCGPRRPLGGIGGGWVR